MVAASRGSKWMINYRTLVALLVPIVLVHVHLYTKLFSHALYNNNDANNHNAALLVDTEQSKVAGLLATQKESPFKKKSQQLRQGMVNNDIPQRNLNHTTINTGGSIVVPPKQQQQQSSSLSQPYRKWAYVYLMGGCNPNKPYYRGYLYNILISAYILQEAGTKADIVVMVQMSSEVDPARASLPLEDTQLLKEMGVIVVYLPQPPPDQESFYHLQLAKFHILRLTEYSRVFFLDADVMPFCNVDYMFELSEPKIDKEEEQEDSQHATTTNSQQSPPSPPSVRLKENVILAYKTVPAAGSYFILKPGPGEYEEITDIIRRREQEAPTLPYPHFDRVRGWGHVITAPGLLYYWTKYVKKNVSIVVDHEVENWASSQQGGGELRLEETLDGSLDKYTCLPLDKGDKGTYGASFPIAYGKTPYRDLFHFVGRTKVWENPPAKINLTSKEEATDPRDYWLYHLSLVEKKLNMPEVDLVHLKRGGGIPPLGRYPKHRLLNADGTEVKPTKRKRRRHK